MAGVADSAYLGISNSTSPNKRHCGGGETLTLQMLQQTLRGERSRERAELRKEINGALKGVTARVDAMEKGLECRPNKGRRFRP